MTCQRIYIPNVSAESEVSAVKSRESYVKSPKAENTEVLHCPEIVVSKSKYIEPERKNKGIFRLPLGKIVTAAVLCSASFAVGCSVTNEKMAELIGDIAEISAGNFGQSSETEMREETENITFYEKYMSEEEEIVTDDRIEYLYADKITGEPEAEQIALPEPAEITVSTSSAGKTGIDGEVLYTVFSEDLSASDVHLLNNQTKFSPDTHSLISKTPQALENLRINPAEPLVLVVHTHGTECYNSYENENFTGLTTAVRSENTEENVVGVGKKLVSILNGFGIPAVHSEKMCDKESFVNAYSTSYAEVKSYLEKYPSIRFVIDLHRDAIEHGDGSKTKPVFESFGKKSAQLMFVVGTNQAGANHPDWNENLSLALTLQNEIGKDNPKLFRKINLRTASFNQQLSPGYMLLECGSAANTLEEAETAAELFATGLARVIMSYAA